MAALKRKYSPDRISDQVHGPYPLRLVRLCIRELWSIIENPTVIFRGVGGSGSGGGPGASLATRIQQRWTANGPYRVDTEVDAAWVVPTAMEVTSVWLYRGNAGSSGTTILDMNRNGSTMYTTQANRPKIVYTDADLIVACALPDVISLASGDIVTIDTDQIEAGRPSDWSLTLEGA